MTDGFSISRLIARGRRPALGERGLSHWSLENSVALVNEPASAPIEAPPRPTPAGRPAPTDDAEVMQAPAPRARATWPQVDAPARAAEPSPDPTQTTLVARPPHEDTRPVAEPSAIAMRLETAARTREMDVVEIIRPAPPTQVISVSAHPAPRNASLTTPMRDSQRGDPTQTTRPPSPPAPTVIIESIEVISPRSPAAPDRLAPLADRRRGQRARFAAGRA